MAFILPLFILGVSANESPFAIAELDVQPSPTVASHIATGGDVLSFDIAPDRAHIAAVLISGDVLLWRVGDNTLTSWKTGQAVREVAWSRDGTMLYFLSAHEIIKSDAHAWKPKVVLHSESRLSNLTTGPRTFAHHARLFYGMQDAAGLWATHAITDSGDLDYLVVGSGEQTATWNSQDSIEPPNVLRAESARPTTFHPAGDLLVWQDSQGCHQKAVYHFDNWKGIASFAVPNDCGASLGYLPNGLGVTIWDRYQSGVWVYYPRTTVPTWYGAGTSFVRPPRVVPDGRGMVGVAFVNGLESFTYTPVDLPLGDVTNAWMFASDANERLLFEQNGGLLRPAARSDQLYNVYESEFYDCEGYTTALASRPYLVTTDVFWELYASAFEGIFAVAERTNAIPMFWSWVAGANKDLAARAQDSNLSRSLALLAQAHADGHIPHELQEESYEPLGYYTATPQLSEYFRAMRYLMREGIEVELLAQVPKSVQDSATAWISSYEPFIAGPRSPTIWRGARPIPAYTSHPGASARLFPLSWGADNEALNACIQHSAWRQDEGVAGRALPSGLDVPIALGSKLASALMGEEYARFTSLDVCHERSRKNLAKHVHRDSLYDRWISALAQQWADDVLTRKDDFSGPLWGRKRLQTGLASWATLRHATVLVNDVSASECGEAGFEKIDMRPPRAYVEPDIGSFNALLDLFAATRTWLAKDAAGWNPALRDGVLSRLDESTANVKLFRDIAVKQERGIARTPAEYEAMLYVARAAEHNFLVFKSLQRESEGLAKPDPIEKVADVAHTEGQPSSHLLVGVGGTLEWDQIAPFFGRRQIVKGAVYNYLETVSDKSMNDTAWRSAVKSLPHPEWIAPFIIDSPLDCEPRLSL